MLRIVPLSAATWDALAELFGEGGDPRWCWCMWWRMRAKDFSAARVPDLRAGLRALADGSPAPGLVALDGDRAVGWVSLGPRSSFERLERSRTIPRVDERPVWSVVCFTVSGSARGHGVARQLLDAAVSYAREQGATALEAYPVVPESAGRIEPDAAFTGTIDLFTRAGFREVAATRSSAGGRPRVVARRELDAAGPVERRAEP
jgi:GNAT superfamily N-acetyltransferase